MIIKVRLATKKDLDQIFEVKRKVWLLTYPSKKFGITSQAIEDLFKEKRNSFKGIKQTKESHTWVAIDGEKVVGLCMASKLENGVNYLGATYILNDYQGQGIGRKFVEKACSWFGEGNIKTEVASYNQKAIDFYKKQGFVKSGRVYFPKGHKLPDGSIIPVFEMTKMIEKKD
jgi:ribosomal protein S18 acetylase RimI-like enzyme